MANHWNRILLLGSLIFPLCYITVNGNITQNCTHFQTYSWRNILQRMDLKVQFMLLTRRNPSCAQPISDSNDIQNSNFNGSLPTKLIMHGYRVTGSKPSWVDTLAKELLGAMDVNVVIVDWIIGSTALYHNAVRNSIELGLKIAILIGNLMSHGSTEDSFHLIGISLGAHVAGFVGRMFKGKLGQITGLDPAGPEFSKASVHQRLDPGDAVFVEAIHSDSDKFGISRPVAHIDFYLNDGKDQPKCSQHLLSSGLLERGGLSADVLPKEVKVYLMTSSQPPFCVKHFLLEIFYEQLGFHEQRIKIKFQSHSNASYLHLTIPKKQSNESTIRRVIPYDASFGNVNDVTIQLSSSWRRKRYPIHIEKLRIRELPLNDSERPPRCIYNIVLYREIIFEQLSNCL
ncbi:phospholipase A1 member A isoform X2 [Stegostoma tigrinum]|uniref:phospholipase A1 member A isoform X2 n=1 Tax=Stegostoma tigrinum TaxID=3053191 RepID=UPI0028709601|nr:phospholipase A1 member A isoform X2 [Stegostoma tigrinum]